MARCRCEACGTLLYEIVGAGNASLPITALAPLRKEGDGFFMTCPGCGQRIEFVADPPGGNFVRPLRGVTYSD